MPEQTPVELSIDQGTYFGVSVNDVDEYQSNINLMNTFTDDASQQIQIEVDTTILGSVYADVHASNKGAAAGVKSGGYSLGAVGSPLTVTANDVISVLTRAGAVLDEQNVPHTERFIVVPPWFRYLIMNSNVNNAQLMGDDKSILRNGRVGVIDRFTLYVSNLLASSADGATEILFGHKSAIAFASQITKTETLPNPDDFGQIVRGLNVYGYKVVKPEALGWIHAKM